MCYTLIFVWMGLWQGVYLVYWNLWQFLRFCWRFSVLLPLGVYSSCVSISPWLPRGESFLGNLWVISRFNDLVLWAMFSCRCSSWNGEFWGKSSLWLHQIYIFKSDFVLMYAGIILIRSVFCWPALNMNNLMEILGSLLLSILTHPVQI